MTRRAISQGQIVVAFDKAQFYFIIVGCWYCLLFYDLVEIDRRCHSVMVFVLHNDLGVFAGQSLRFFVYSDQLCFVNS